MRNNYILDANILFSGLLSRKEFYRKIFEKHIFYTPDFAFKEIEKYRNLILQSTLSNPEELKEFTFFIFSKIIVVPDFIISRDSIDIAVELCRDIDLKDVAYVALSIELNHVIVTRDKLLYKGLKSKGFENIMLFEDFFRENT